MSAAPNNRSLWKSPAPSVVLIVADAAGLAICWLGAYWIRYALSGVMGPINDIGPYLKVFALIVAAGVFNCAVFGLYMQRRKIASLNAPGRIIRAGYHWLLYIIAAAFLLKELDLGRAVILIAAVLGVAWLFVSRTMLRAWKERAIRRGQGTIKCAIIGTGALAMEVRDSLKDHPEVGFSLVGMIAHGDSEPAPEGVPLLGTTADFSEIAEREEIEEVFVALAHLDNEAQLDLLGQAEHRGIRIHVVSKIFDVLTSQAKVDEIATFPVVTLKDGHLPLHQEILKRTLDLACAVTGIVLWLAFLHWWIALAIKRDSPGPVFFKQKRVGRDGAEFDIWKYRTMRTDAEAYAVAPTAEEDPRITRLGRWLRRKSLDELPQLINVLRGEMSIVGPRPEMPFIAAKYTAWERRRLDVKPGVTGLWQVIGRKNLPLHLNMQYDLYYIKNQSFLLDLEILIRTIPAVVKGKGAF